MPRHGHPAGVTQPSDPAAGRQAFEQQVGEMVGKRIWTVRYWDVHNYSASPREWDYGEWHHAVMGVELDVESEFRFITWGSRFFSYGVEVWPGPASDHLIVGAADGPEGWPVEHHARWLPLIGSPIRRATVLWERVDVGAGYRLGDGAQVSEPTSYQVPVSLRLDFVAGPMWFVVGIPGDDDLQKTFMMGDEIMVVFSREAMLKIGFPDVDFLGAGA
jgi:hypothetical protein